jgi:hypothetical protein
MNNITTPRADGKNWADVVVEQAKNADVGLQHH